MKKNLIIFLLVLACQNLTFAQDKQEEITESLSNELEDVAEQVIEMEENKLIVNVLKQPLNENSKQKIIMRKNWFVLNIGVNGKVKVNPLANTYEVE